ncbi:hypothetical protein BsWGS_26035 [Bradybaena similaris]
MVEKTCLCKFAVRKHCFNLLQNVRRLFALVSECSKHRALIEEVLTQIADRSVVAELAGRNPEMALVLLYEYLLGHKFGRNVALRKKVQEYKQEIAGAVAKVLQKHQAKTLLEIARKVSEKTLIQIPRYMRVNLIKSNVEDVVEGLVAEGWEYVGKLNIDQFSETARSLDKWQFGLDPLLFDLLVFPVGTDLHDHALTKSGVLIQQDRASCVPAHVLNPARGSVALDCCSAPGNKTSHLASLMNDTGRVIALDRDQKRMETMYKLIETSGATCVEMIVQDFLTVRPDSDDARDIQFILVDPSCSGSGMLGSKNEIYDCSTDTHRLQTLKRFQIVILKHALRFPAVQRVVYSTCSVHAEENEQVVEEVMAQVSEYFKFKEILPQWKCSRGLDGYPNSRFFLRLSPEADLTQGFFVACFERIKSKYGQAEEEVTQEHGTHVVATSKEVNIESPREVKDDASKMNISHRKKRKKSMTNETISEDETAVEYSTGSIEACNLDISGKRKKKKHNTVKSDLESGTPCLKPDNDVCSSETDKKCKFSCHVITSGDCGSCDFVQVSKEGNNNVIEESYRNKKHKKEGNNNVIEESYRNKKHKKESNNNVIEESYRNKKHKKEGNNNVIEESYRNKKHKKKRNSEFSPSDDKESSRSRKQKKETNSEFSPSDDKESSRSRKQKTETNSEFSPSDDKESSRHKKQKKEPKSELSLSDDKEISGSRKQKKETNSEFSPSDDKESSRSKKQKKETNSEFSPSDDKESSTRKKEPKSEFSPSNDKESSRLKKEKKEPNSEFSPSDDKESSRSRKQKKEPKSEFSSSDDKESSRSRKQKKEPKSELSPSDDKESSRSQKQKKEPNSEFNPSDDKESSRCKKEPNSEFSPLDDKESSRSQKQKNKRKLEPSLSLENLSSATPALKKKKHKEQLPIEDGSFISSHQKHRAEGSVSDQMNLGSHEGLKLNSDTGLRNNNVQGIDCVKHKKKKKKKECGQS